MDGEIVQHIEYVPFGEVFIEERNNTWNTPYLFNAKELDEETGLYYVHARYYDPKISIWLSVDPKAESSSNISGYVYCNLNPIQYVDPDGEFPILSSIVGFTRGLISSKGNFKQAVSTAWKTEKNSWKQLGGLFIADKDKSLVGKIGQIASRLTWELPQTLVGYTINSGANMFFDSDVDYYAGATVTKINNKDFGGVTMGSYILGDQNIEANPNNQLFQHEYGHYLQSQKYGPTWAFIYGFPSLYDAATQDYWGHTRHYSEQDANKRAIDYWKKRNSNYSGWDHFSNPIYNPTRATHHQAPVPIKSSILLLPSVKPIIP